MDGPPDRLMVYRSMLWCSLRRHPAIAHLLEDGCSMRLYTSVFIHLDCKYWSADAEKRMRAKISATAPNPN
jgi:hypothetical protein